MGSCVGGAVGWKAVGGDWGDLGHHSNWLMWMLLRHMFGWHWKIVDADKAPLCIALGAVGSTHTCMMA